MCKGLYLNDVTLDGGRGVLSCDNPCYYKYAKRRDNRKKGLKTALVSVTPFKDSL